MKKALSIIFPLFLTILIFLSIGFSLGNGTSDEISKADDYCNEISQSVNKKILVCRYFADVGEFKGDDNKWMEFKSFKARKKGCKEGCWDFVDVYYKDRALVYLHDDSYTEDSSDDMSFYFRPDCSVIKLDWEGHAADLETDEVLEAGPGNLACDVLQTRYYDSSGKCIKKTALKYFDSRNHQRLKKVTGFWGKLKDGKFPFFTNIKQFPFYKILGK